MDCSDTPRRCARQRRTIEPGSDGAGYRLPAPGDKVPAFRALSLHPEHGQLSDLAGNPLVAPVTARFDLAKLTIIAESGTPADEFQASANCRQLITIESAGITAAAKVTFPTRDSNAHARPTRCKHRFDAGRRFGQSGSAR